MSAKQLRRLRGDKGCLGAIPAEDDAASATSSGEESSDDAPAPTVSAFALLGGGDSDSESESESDSSEASAPRAVDKGKDPLVPEPGLTAGRGKDDADADADDDAEDDKEFDEIDRVLMEMGEALPGDDDDGNGGAEDEDDSGARDADALLVTDKRWVNPDAETRRMFGARAVEDARAGPNAGIINNNNNGRGGAGQRARPQRSTFVTPGADWPRFMNPGITMERRDGSGTGTGTGPTFALTFDEARYGEARSAFESAVETYDHHSFFEVLRHHPFCVHALAQLSDVYRQHGQHEQSEDLNARVLFAFERSFHSDFDPFSGKCRLPRDTEAADLFYHALFRHMTLAGARGCSATAFEISRLLLSLDPDNDPSFSLLLMDHYALRAGRPRALLAMLTTFEGGALSCLPNWAYSGALAVKRVAAAGNGVRDSGDAANQNKKKSAKNATGNSDGGDGEIGELQGVRDAATLDPDDALEHAMLLFPSVVVPLLTKCGATVIPAGNAAPASGSSAVVLGTHFLSEPRSAALRHLSALFAERNHTLWKDQSVLPWLKRIAERCQRTVNEGKDPRIKELRHLRDTEYPPRGENPFSACGLADYADVPIATLPQDDPLGLGDDQIGRAARQVNAEVIPDNDFLAFLTTMMPWNRVRGARGGGGNNNNGMN